MRRLEVKGSDGGSLTAEMVTTALTWFGDFTDPETVRDPEAIRAAIEKARIYILHGRLCRLPLPAVPEEMEGASEAARLLWQLDEVLVQIMRINDESM
ncbi:hypothetical protein HNR23_002275 [Nocardiopsis mwathae]|uniref:Uncharacterized protein n=1 Tax=Nocardiopsis mwathae TaxID=1472723 RepID=A0A7W9YHT4_9ACTN|nr:hypothetical protein [Nocardiopsis mwathae]MBB6172215.1 hypothetical protein [Nocardiopsis mwathae]